MIKELGFEKIVKEESDIEETEKVEEHVKSKDKPKKEKEKKKEKETKTEKELLTVKKEEIHFDVDEILTKHPLESYDKILLKNCVPWHDPVGGLLIP